MAVVLLVRPAPVAIAVYRAAPPALQVGREEVWWGVVRMVGEAWYGAEEKTRAHNRTLRGNLNMRAVVVFSISFDFGIFLFLLFFSV